MTNFIIQIALDGCGKQLDNLERQLSSLCGEKENLEAMLYDVQNNLGLSENRCKQMEREKQELLIKQVKNWNNLHQWSPNYISRADSGTPSFIIWLAKVFYITALFCVS